LLVVALHQPSLLSIDQTKGNFQAFNVGFGSTCKANENGVGKAISWILYTRRLYIHIEPVNFKEKTTRVQ
jgi:hypothetical protein